MAVVSQDYRESAVATSNGEWKREGEMVMMVKEASACLFWANEERLSSQMDHKGVTKLGRSENGPYGTVRAAIESVPVSLVRQPSVLSQHNHPNSQFSERGVVASGPRLETESWFGRENSDA